MDVISNFENEMKQKSRTKSNLGTYSLILNTSHGIFPQETSNFLQNLSIPQNDPVIVTCVEGCMCVSAQCNPTWCLYQWYQNIFESLECLLIYIVTCIQDVP